MSLENVDWSKLPEPQDNGEADHLTGSSLPACALVATDGSQVDLSMLDGTVVVYAYPMTGRPDIALPHGWDMIPGARGCTPQSCSFRDYFQELKVAGAAHVFGLSRQGTDYQKEAAARLHLPFALLSDADGHLTDHLKLPTMTVDGKILLRRLTLIIRDKTIVQMHYPVFPPDQDAIKVLSWLRENPL